MQKAASAYKTISEVSEALDIPAHVLRFWETKFSSLRPLKRSGGRRYYRPADMLLIGGIRKLLHEDGMTIKGAQKILREKGIKHVSSLSPPLEAALSKAAHPPIEEIESAEQNEPATPQDNVIKLAREPALPADTEHKDEPGQQTALNFWSDEDPNGALPEKEPIVADTEGLIAAIQRLSPIVSKPGDELQSLAQEIKAELERRKASTPH